MFDKIALKAKQKEAQQQWMDVELDASGKSKPTSSRRKSWAEAVAKELGMPELKRSLWDNFDIAKVVNAGFKLDYVAPTTLGESSFVEIELEDSTFEIEYWHNTVVCYVLGAHSPFTVLKR